MNLLEAEERRISEKAIALQIGSCSFMVAIPTEFSFRLISFVFAPGMKSKDFYSSNVDRFQVVYMLHKYAH